MVYSKPLPRIDNIMWLAKLASPFPATRRQIWLKAKAWNFSHSTLEFLELFPANERFESRADFLNRCYNLELLIRQVRASSPETLRSPQE